MPFIGRDWRSPGEAWVKTESLGWQRMKIIESQLYSSCQQNPACSWPPRSEFGQHMAENCKTDETRDGRNSSGFRGSLSSGCSSSSSRCGSTSPSPSGSPEKNINHLYPITVSSPYGKYSCCAHHVESNSNKMSYYDVTPNSSQPNAQTISISLSKDITKTKSSNSSQKLRYNNDHSDFQNSPTDSEDSSLRENNYSQKANDFNAVHKISEQARSGNPILMRNGCRMDEPELPVSEQTDYEDCAAKQEQQSSQMNTCCCSSSTTQQSPCHSKEPHMRTAPHCRISVRTREVAMYNTISEAFYRLDFCNAIHDIRRFNYICKLLHLLITQNLTSLSGCATKVLFNMLEQVAWEVSSNKRNIHVLKNLLNELKLMIQKYYCWGRPIGSSLLWQQHFDTIERISQIVDGIELSPPKKEIDEITFDNLPVEMIREILLRLNDYRDLVNSAQASPVMRTMIDGHQIWQQLCRYHFTEQQLKMALDNQNGQFLKKSNTRGVKYARTTSADGRTSFRNPVSHANKQKCSTRQQLEQTSGRRGSRQGDNATDKPGSSYVTKAIRIFDKAGPSSSPPPSSKVIRVDSGCEKQNESRATTSQDHSRRASKSSEVGQQANRASTSRLAHEIDWERVFHQLRKKYDLKEEYADCLLLCRHCRCLFWKSFGHPCIKNDESTSDEGCSSFKIDNSCSIINNAQNVCNCDAINRSRRLNAQEQQEVRDRHHQAQSRLSVAALSRNFDNRAQRSNSVSDDAENIPPQSSPPLNQRVRQPSNSLQNNSLVGSGLGERGIRLNHRVIGENNNNNGNEDNNEHNSNNNNNPIAQAAIKRTELVPKHVTISPQAFLKFFSL